MIEYYLITVCRWNIIRVAGSLFSTGLVFRDGIMVKVGRRPSRRNCFTHFYSRTSCHSILHSLRNYNVIHTAYINVLLSNSIVVFFFFLCRQLNLFNSILSKTSLPRRFLPSQQHIWLLRTAMNHQRFYIYEESKTLVHLYCIL